MKGTDEETSVTSNPNSLMHKEKLIPFPFATLENPASQNLKRPPHEQNKHIEKRQKENKKTERGGTWMRYFLFFLKYFSPKPCRTASMPLSSTRLAYA